MFAGRRVDHQHAARGCGVDVDVVQTDACARHDLQLRRRGQHLGVDGRRGADQQRVGLRHGGQQLLAIGTVHPADLYLVTERSNGRFGQFVGDQYDGETHPARLMGLNEPVMGGRIPDVDVTVVGSGPNGLAAAVICARAGLSVRVVEGQPTAGGGARSAPDPEFPGVRHDICSAVHPLGIASPFFAEFDLAARGVTLVAPEVSYANPLPGRPAAVAYRSLDRTCDELDDGASWRRLFGPLTEHVDGVIGLLPRRQAVAAARPGHHCAHRSAGAGPGQPGVGPASRRRRPCVVHRRWHACHFKDAVAWSTAERG